ncbi:alpha/beta fold hydrolase [Plantactinospora siamensis]|uniref:Alpha/beta fold hydrolase n=1 Tax=Plantactinospora siamensis TaxID=555372 RepID=A0ABV6NUH1_9ACTN
MIITAEAMLPVPGASLYYQVRGSGQVLLLMSGGHGDANSFDALLPALAERFTVVTYDRRGYARSPMASPTMVPTVATHGDDAAAILGAIGGGPSLVFGTSTGAVIGLDLAVRHPAAIDRLIAHEPPLVQLLPETDRPALPGDLIGQLRERGPDAAMASFRALLGVDLDDREPGTQFPVVDPVRARSNALFFFTREAPMLDQFTPDLSALQVPVFPAAGVSSSNTFPHRCAVLLAERLGEPVTTFPGGHAGFTTHPTAFTRQLLALLRDG